MPLHRSDITLLLALPTIIESGSINRAAERLNMSQPALTRNIQRLEQSVGAAVLERSGRGVRITALGEALIAHARTMNAELQRTNLTIDAIVSSSRGLVRIGATTTFGSMFTTPALVNFLSGRPQIVTEVFYSERPALLDLLKAGRLDVVVCPAYETIEPEVVEIPLFDVDLEVLARRRHPFANASKLRLHDIVDANWILPLTSSRLYQQLRNEFSRRGETIPTADLHTGSVPTMRELLLSSDRLAIQSRQAFWADLNAGTVVSLKGDWNFGTRTVNLCLRDHATPLSPVKEFIEFLIAQARERFGAN